jgi:hypothetical protein
MTCALEVMVPLGWNDLERRVVGRRRRLDCGTAAGSGRLRVHGPGCILRANTSRPPPNVGDQPTFLCVEAALVGEESREALDES